MSGQQYAKTAVIDLRGWDDCRHLAAGAIPIHYQWRSFSIRERLDREYGDHGNQVIWRFSQRAAAVRRRPRSLTLRPSSRWTSG